MGKLNPHRSDSHRNSVGVLWVGAPDLPRFHSFFKGKNFSKLLHVLVLIHHFDPSFIFSSLSFCSYYKPISSFGGFSKTILILTRFWLYFFHISLIVFPGFVFSLFYVIYPKS